MSADLIERLLDGAHSYRRSRNGISRLLDEAADALAADQQAAKGGEAITDTMRIEWIEHQVAQYGDGHTEPLEAHWHIQWQQSKPGESWQGVRAWLDAEIAQAGEDMLDTLRTVATTHERSEQTSSGVVAMLVLAAKNAATALRNCVVAGEIGAGYEQYAQDVDAALVALSTPPPSSMAPEAMMQRAVATMERMGWKWDGTYWNHPEYVADLAAQPAVQGEREGYVCVPVVPTDAMCAAYWREVVAPDNPRLGDKPKAAARWAAFLAAAPNATGNGGSNG